MVGNATLERMRQGAESLVIRARAGDQNAIAMISQVRESVPRSRRAALAFDLIRDYIRKNPVVGAAFGGITLHSRRRAMRRIAESSLCASPKYSGIVLGIERLPTDLDRYAEAACLVADGRRVDAAAIRDVLPVLRGDLAISDGKAASLGHAHRAGVKIAEQWEIELGKEGLKIVPTGGFVLGFQSNGKVYSSPSMFAAAFVRAPRGDLVQQIADPLPSRARQPVRVGYVLGLARRIQDVRMGQDVALLSELAAWELGE